MRSGHDGPSSTSLTEHHLRKVALVQSAMAPAFTAPEPFRPLPLTQWFETVHSNDILSHLDVPLSLLVMVISSIITANVM